MKQLSLVVTEDEIVSLVKEGMLKDEVLDTVQCVSIDTPEGSKVVVILPVVDLSNLIPNAVHPYKLLLKLDAATRLLSYPRSMYSGIAKATSTELLSWLTCIRNCVPNSDTAIALDEMLYELYPTILYHYGTYIEILRVESLFLSYKMNTANDHLIKEVLRSNPSILLNRLFRLSVSNLSNADKELIKPVVSYILLMGERVA